MTPVEVIFLMVAVGGFAVVVFELFTANLQSTLKSNSYDYLSKFEFSTVTIHL